MMAEFGPTWDPEGAKNGFGLFWVILIGLVDFDVVLGVFGWIWGELISTIVKDNCLEIYLYIYIYIYINIYIYYVHVRIFGACMYIYIYI